MRHNSKLNSASNEMSKTCMTKRDNNIRHRKKNCLKIEVTCQEPNPVWHEVYYVTEGSS